MHKIAYKSRKTQKIPVSEMSPARFWPFWFRLWWIFTFVFQGFAVRGGGGASRASSKNILTGWAASHGALLDL